MRKKLTTEEFIYKAREVHGDKYDYSLVNYINNHTTVRIVCPIHGEFEQKPVYHINCKSGCPKCSNYNKVKRKTKEQFIKDAQQIHGDRYDYSQVKYINNKTKVKIFCREHGIFKQTPHAHIQLQQGCPFCLESKLEREMREILIYEGIDFEQQKTFDWLKLKKQLHLDFYLPKKNIAIECQGEQHFIEKDYFGGKTTLDKIIERDKEKEILCNKYGIKLLYFSNLGIDYPYEVIEDKDLLLEKIKSGA